MRESAVRVLADDHAGDHAVGERAPVVLRVLEDPRVQRAEDHPGPDAPLGRDVVLLAEVRRVRGRVPARRHDGHAHDSTDQEVDRQLVTGEPVVHRHAVGLVEARRDALAPRIHRRLLAGLDGVGRGALPVLQLAGHRPEGVVVHRPVVDERRGRPVGAVRGPVLVGRGAEDVEGGRQRGADEGRSRCRLGHDRVDHELRGHQEVRIGRQRDGGRHRGGGGSGDVRELPAHAGPELEGAGDGRARVDRVPELHEHGSQRAVGVAAPKALDAYRLLHATDHDPHVRQVGREEVAGS